MSVLRDALRDLPESVFFDLLESDEAYLLVVDVPGVSATELDPAVGDGYISIDTHREKPRPDGFEYIEENRQDSVEIDVPLPKGATGDGAEASVSRGVLELRLPKQETGETTIDVVESEGV